MEVPLAQLVAALPLYVLSLCHPLVLRRQSPSTSPLPRPSPAAVAATALPPLPQPPCCCHRAAAVAMCAASALPLLPPLPLLLPPLHRSLVGCCVVVRRPISSSHAIIRLLMLSLSAWTFLYELVCTNSDNIHFSDKHCYAHKLYKFV